MNNEHRSAVTPFGNYIVNSVGCWFGTQMIHPSVLHTLDELEQICVTDFEARWKAATLVELLFAEDAPGALIASAPSGSFRVYHGGRKWDAEYWERGTDFAAWAMRFDDKEPALAACNREYRRIVLGEPEETPEAAPPVTAPVEHFDPGTVVCGFCGADWSNSEKCGGFLIGGKLCCPACETDYLLDLRRRGNLDQIQAKCDSRVAFRDFARSVLPETKL